MAARTRKARHDDETRAKIQVAQIINRMQKCIDGKIALDAQQVSCAKALLNKRLPDLASVQMSGDIDNPIIHVIENTIVRPKKKT